MNKTLLAQQAAEATINKVHAYMRANPQSELHRQGKMFGILVCADSQGGIQTLQAFSAMLDGSYHYEGFVPPVYEMSVPPIGTSRQESQRLQRLLFANYRFTNAQGETRNLLDIFSHEPPILSPEEWFHKSSITNHQSPITSPLPPSGAGECCAPKLLQYALTHHLTPLALAEFWVGVPPRTELRQEGVFYPPCSGKCVPILRHMLKGIDLVILRSDTPYTQTEISAIDILFEDEWLMVVNKPSGVLSVPGKSDESSLTQHLCAQHNYPFLQPVHRLDQDTSGVLVLAKTPETYKILQAYFQRRDILKRYEALIVPQPHSQLHNNQSAITNNQSPLTISLPLLPNPYDRPRQMVDYEHGKLAITTYSIREFRSNGTIFIDFFPQTGRTHQLRVHAAHPEGLNAPILGDRLYGNPNHTLAPAVSDRPSPAASNKQSLPTTATRLYLHAAEISFTHPVTKKEMHFCIPSGF